MNMSGADIPIISYSDLGSHLVENKRMPNNGMIEVTHRCNFKCAHCYVPHESVKPELSKQELYDIIDVIAEEGCMWVTFTGGEPFVRRDFMDIYIYAKKRGLLVSVFTNGSLITPRIADQFLDFPPISVSITVYGATRETYEAVTGSAESYDHIMRAINLLLERKIRLEIKTMVMTLNKHELWEINM